MKASRIIFLVLLLGLSSCAKSRDELADGIAGRWRAWLDSPGGELPFGLTIEQGNDSLRSWIENGVERIQVPVTTFSDDELRLEITHFDAVVSAHLQQSNVLSGEWRRRSAGENVYSRLAFHAQKGPRHRFTPLTNAAQGNIQGRWRVDFESEEDDAVGIFENVGGGRVHGTFLTTKGDYRFLAGSFEGDRLRLSCFDGSHVFLFHATLQQDGTLRGDFWSRDVWHETWTAERDTSFELRDPLSLTHWQQQAQLEDFAFPDLQGTPRRLDDPQFAGKARLIEVFGTWCPNCRDATHYMVELYRNYAARGLSVVGLAFEMTGDFARDSKQVARYVEQHGIEYPVLVAGLSSKAEAAKSFPALDRVYAYPTTIFLDANNTVRAVYTGFSGPATGEKYEQLKKTFESLIEEMLSESS